MGASQEQIQTVMRQSVGCDFGISRDTIYSTFPNIPTGRFAYLLGDDRGEFDRICDIIESEGVSPAVWVAYESSEGYNSQLGWLNHTYWQGDIYQDARVVARWLKTSVGTTPAWDDPYGGTIGVVPPEVQAQGNAEFNSWPAGTIGKTYTGGTAAAAWGMWYPQALSARVNGVQDYGNPLDRMADLIFNVWGGKVEGQSIPNTNPAPQQSTEQKVEIKEDNSDKRNGMLDAVNNMVDMIRDMFNQNVYRASDKYMFNNVIKLTKNMNLWRVQLSDEALNNVKQTLEDAINNVLRDKITVTTGTSSGEVKPNENAQHTQQQPATDRITNALNTIAGFIGGGTPGADFGSGDGNGNQESQCYALSGYFAGLVSGYTCAMSYNGQFQALSAVGDTYNAHSLWCGWNWSDAGAHTQGYQGIAMPAVDLKVGMIFCTAPYQNGPTGNVDGGGNAYLVTYENGHTGVIESFTDSTVTVIEQNAYLANSTIPNRRVARITYPRDAFLNTVSGVVWWD